MRRGRIAWAAIVGLAAMVPVVAARRGESEVMSRVITPEARQEAALIFVERCAVCHGMDGSGEGPGASNLNPKPANLRSREWQTSVSDEKIAKVIVNGGASEGLSASMASNPDLEDKPDVVAALVAQIRKFRR